MSSNGSMLITIFVTPMQAEVTSRIHSGTTIPDYQAPASNVYKSWPRTTSPTQIAMSGKYTFTKALKELRFLHCQTSDHSNAVR